MGKGLERRKKKRDVREGWERDWREGRKREMCEKFMCYK